MKKCVTVDSVLVNIRDPEKMNPKKMSKVIELLKLKQDEAMTRTQNDLLVRYCHWIHVEKRDRRLIDGEEHNLNAGNSTYCADKLILDDAVDEFIATDINADNSTDFAEDAAGGLIAAINADNSTDCADLLISNFAADVLIATGIDADNLTDFYEDAAGELIDAINYGSFMDCATITVSDDAEDGLIAIDIDTGNLADCAEDTAGG